MRSGTIFTRKWIIWLTVLAAGSISAALLWHFLRSHAGTFTIQGAVIRQDTDSRKELPIPGTAVTVFDGETTRETQSDDSGYFRLVLRRRNWIGQTLRLTFRHADYQPLDLTAQIGLNPKRGQLVVAAMKPAASPGTLPSNSTISVITNIRIRYTTNSEQKVNIGSAVRTFQVINTGNVPCDHNFACSPDGKWKAASGTEEMDAGAGNEFGNARASCIAGPCPFTQIDTSGFIGGGRVIHATALNWSDTATFLLEAEVFQTAITSNVRQSYPVIFGNVLNFTLPPTQEGASIEAEIDGAPMVFPLGPDLYLSWATCSARTNTGEGKSTVYRCELKPNYRF